MVIKMLHHSSSKIISKQKKKTMRKGIPCLKALEEEKKPHFCRLILKENQQLDMEPIMIFIKCLLTLNMIKTFQVKWHSILLYA